MVRRIFVRAAAALCLVLACLSSGQAQVTTGNVRGVVTDPQGAVVPGSEGDDHQEVE